MTPLSTTVNLCRVLIWPSGEWSRAGMMYQGLTARRGEISVTKSPFARYPPMAWLGMPTTGMLRRACESVNCGCTRFPVTKSCPSSSKETTSSGDHAPRRIWPHPNHSPWMFSSA